ncbi:MAG: electron transfer flavoprotein subunit beta/FixA family protein [Phycisphaerales bacterium]|nr:MAG: electron transfer flavoprotein subunit beta/FixA family protein [Phycisphaerales bacterium]
MRILTIAKQVPDSNASIKIKPDGSDIELTGLKQVLDPFDEFGVELGIQLREKRSDVTEVVALTLGPDKASEALRVALAMGADTGIHINDPAFESKNELFAAQIIAESIKKDEAGFDLILCGKYNIDLDSGAFGPALAEYLDMPHIGALQGMDMADDGKSFMARRRIEGAEEVLECDLPALLTIEKGMVEPRYPSLPNLMKAKKKPVTVLTSAELSADASLNTGVVFESVTPPPPRPECKFVEGEPDEMVKELVRLLREEAKVI